MVVFGQKLDLKILKGFSNINDSVIFLVFQLLPMSSSQKFYRVVSKTDTDICPVKEKKRLGGKNTRFCENRLSGTRIPFF